MRIDGPYPSIRGRPDRRTVRPLPVADPTSGGCGGDDPANADRDSVREARLNLPVDAGVERVASDAAARRRGRPVPGDTPSRYFPSPSSIFHMIGDEESTAPVAAGALAGIVAWVIGYGLAYLVAAGRIREQLAGLNTIVGLLEGGTLPTWKAVAWLYFNAHFVDVRLAAAGRQEGMSLLSRAAGDASLLYLLPPLALLCCAALAMGALNVSSLRRASIGGAASSVGYAVAALATAALSAHAFGIVVVSVGLATAVALAGVGYPLVFGTLGGALVGQLRS